MQGRVVDKSLGKHYKAGDCVVRKGEVGNCMYVVQNGELEVIDEKAGKEISLRRLEAGDIFGEMALFERQPRSATVRAVGEAQVLTVDKRTLLRRIKEDPLVALNLIEDLCRRIRAMSGELASLKAGHNQGG
jgi:CRP-like cAMP-binding protein